MNTESIKIDQSQEGGIFDALVKLGFTKKADPNPYLKWKLSNGAVTVLLYSSMKLVVQGNVDLKSILNIVTGNQVEQPDYIPHIGADEVGKGDYFGPLIVAACYIPSEAYARVASLGITDSKKLSDRQIVDMYSKIKDLVVYKITTLMPNQYNTEYKIYMNVAKLLAKLHGENIKDLVKELSSRNFDYNYAVIDQFSTNKGRLGKEMVGVEFMQMHHAESQDLPTATASIIARTYFLKAIEEMSQHYDFPFPLGAVHVVEQGREFVKKYGKDELENVAKVSFRTTQTVLY
ncbi:MAG TPA: ribonuclease HIII [Candidatus Dojkabacteria bacterium]|nr:ribonuclease HIII [Candidatus Dojkabacteria bacterium]